MKAHLATGTLVISIAQDARAKQYKTWIGKSQCFVLFEPKGVVSFVEKRITDRLQGSQMTIHVAESWGRMIIIVWFLGPDEVVGWKNQ